MTAVDQNELRARLTPLQYQVTQEAVTERPFTGIYWDNHDTGVYRCIVCHEPLFDSGTKFESGTGWPSFYDVVAQGKVKEITDRSFGMWATSGWYHSVDTYRYSVRWPSSFTPSACRSRWVRMSRNGVNCRTESRGTLRETHFELPCGRMYIIPALRTS